MPLAPRKDSQTWTRAGQVGAALPSQTWTRAGAPQSQTWTRSSQTWTRLAVAIAAGFATLVPGAAYAAPAPLDAAAAAFVVRAVPGELAAVDAEVRRLGGEVTRQIRLVDADVAMLTPSAVATLRRDPRVASVTEDGRVQLAGDDGDDRDRSDSDDEVADTTTTLEELRAQIGVPKGSKGSGIGVALIDSGLAPVKGLSKTRIANGPDLSFESQSDDLRHMDTFGHGTHLGGIIASKQGVARGARLVNLKVADAHGAADVSQVLAALDWVVEHRNDGRFAVRVVNLSFGTDSQQSYVTDPLAYAAEQAWHKGIVVVTSAGNRGAGDNRITNPAIDPYVIAVGAADTQGTLDRRDDVVADFSSTGSAARRPDLLAPGARIASLRAPGSFIDLVRGAKARVGTTLLRGGGTSQAAAAVAGAAAVLLGERPELTPDQVKALLVSTATPVAGGPGMIDLAAALAAPAPAADQTWQRSTGTGSLHAARGTSRVSWDGIELTGEQDIFGRPFDATAHAAATAAGHAWSGGTWNGSVWTGGIADGDSFAATTWGSTTWGASSWAGQNWAASSWASSTWASSTWGSSNWASDGWRGPVPSGSGSASSTWGSSTWGSSNWASSNWASSNWASSNWASSNWASSNWG